MRVEAVAARDGRIVAVGSETLDRIELVETIKEGATVDAMKQDNAETAVLTALVGSWTLVALDGEPVESPDKAITLEVAEDGAVAGVSGVNRFMTRLETADLAQGRLALRPPMDGDGEVTMLVVDTFDGVWPGETCGARMSVSELEDTTWKLTRLGAKPVLVEPQQREPHLVLRSEDGRFAGFDGCNRLMGDYTIDGTAIDFS